MAVTFPTMMSHPTRLVFVTSLVFVLFAGLVPAALGEPRAEGEIEQDLGEVLSEEEQLTTQLDSLTAETGEAEAELAIITARLEDAQMRLVAAEGQVELAQAALIEAEGARDEARAVHAAAEAELRGTELDLAKEEGTLESHARSMYKHGNVAAAQGDGILHLIQHANNPNDFSVSMRHLGVVSDIQVETVHHVAELRVAAAEQEDAADERRHEAQVARREARDYYLEVEDLRQEVAELERRIASEEEQQATLVAELQEQYDDLTDVFVRVSVQKDELLEELAERRAVVRGAGGGPDMIGGKCPVQGAVVGQSFINDWGFPRSGGRRHQGNDMFAPEGTPIVAIDDGVVIRMNPEHQPTALGGVTVTYRTDDGSEWYNAHLHTIATGLQVGDRIRNGQVIGTVGRTGNARTTPPHNHIQRRYGGTWVNPYPTIAALCSSANAAEDS